MLVRVMALAIAGLVGLAMVAHEVLPHEHAATAYAQSGHDASRWHAPTDHEHGDAPPAWIAEAGYVSAFDAHGGFHGGTSALENTAKHVSMKGMVAQFGDQQAYIRTHMTGLAMERMGRYHSYEVFMRDAQGGVSHWQGWFNSGHTVNDRVSRSLGDPGRRPVVLVVDEAALYKGITCEQWYGFTASWSWDLGLTICSPPAVYFPEEGQYLDFFWQTAWYGLAGLGLDREVEASWYGLDSAAAPNRGNPPKGVTFYATQFGEIVSGQDSPRCSEMTVDKDGLNRPNLCLSQFIATTARAVQNPNNRQRRAFPGADTVKVPN